MTTSRKKIALVAHDNQKEKLAGWASRHKARLIEHDLYATAHTADVIAATLNVPVFRLLSGPLGGDQQIGSRIAEKRIDVLVFFWDPLEPQPHDCDVKALLRLAAVYNIPNACNEATADCIISALMTENSKDDSAAETSGKPVVLDGETCRSTARQAAIPVIEEHLKTARSDSTKAAAR